MAVTYSPPRAPVRSEMTPQSPNAEPDHLQNVPEAWGHTPTGSVTGIPSGLKTRALPRGSELSRGGEACQILTHTQAHKCTHTYALGGGKESLPFLPEDPRAFAPPKGPTVMRKGRQSGKPSPPTPLIPDQG